MITKDNYSQELRNIPVNELPADLKELHDFALESSDNGRNWDAYEDKDVKPIIDHYFKKLNEFLSTDHPEAKKAEPVKKQAVRKILENEPIKEKKPEPVVRKSETKIKGPSKIDQDQSIELVEKIPEELKFIRRCLSLNGKIKTKQDLLRFINSLHRSIVEKRIRKNSPYASQINFIQEKLVKKYNSMTKPEEMILTNKTISEFKEIISSQKVMPSVPLIKRYISLNGQIGMKGKAKKLSEDMKKAIEKGKVMKSDKYIKLYSDMLSKLDTFINNKNQKSLDIQQAELSGLNGILGNTDKKVIEVGEIAKPSLHPGARILNSMDFSEMSFETLGFRGKWLALIGDPSKGFKLMVFGKPKKGKSILCVDFAGYLARSHGKVLYVAREEGLDYTLQTKIKSKEVAHPNLDVTDEIPADLSDYQFIFLDSVNKLGLKPKDLDALEKAYPDISFIYVFQTRKDGSARGANEYMHNVDAVIEIPQKGKAVQFGRFNQGGEMDIFPEELDQAAGLEGKSSNKSVKLNENEKILYDILSPDGFTIRINKDSLFKTREEALDYYKKWKKRFEIQGYYSSTYGRISLIDLDDECSWEEIPESKARSWIGFKMR